MPGIFTCARVQRVRLGHALDLRDDDAAAVVHGHRDGQRLSSVSASRSIVRLPSVSAVVARIRRDVDGEGLVEEVVLAVDRHQPHQVFGGALLLMLAAAVTRVDEGAQAHSATGAPACRQRCRGTGARSRPGAGSRPVALPTLPDLQAALEPAHALALLPWVKLSGTTPAARLAAACRRRSARRRSSPPRRHPAPASPCPAANGGPHAGQAVGLQFHRTDSAFMRASGCGRASASTLAVMPIRFCTWWPTSCAMT
jgi:hypothetical protein